MTLIFIQNVSNNMEYFLIQRHVTAENKKGLMKIKLKKYAGSLLL